MRFSYQTIVVEHGTARRFFLPPGTEMHLRDPEGGQRFRVTVEAGETVLVRFSTVAQLPENTRLSGAVLIDPPLGAQAELRLGSTGAGATVVLEVISPAEEWKAFWPARLPDLQTAPLKPYPGFLYVTIPLATREGTYTDLPDPLAPVVGDFRIAGATAMVYPVRAGQYIQILNVHGCQCADFLAFAAADTAEELDSTLTRTLNGTAMPHAGLHNRYFSQKMRPLLEVVQDTCERHDSFLVACTDSYYEDAGYPGHLSCTTNFNLNLAPHAIAPRAGWPAVNFFYNTVVESDGTIRGGESSARPGDYVLLRACEDLLCATSSCADDIDAVNGWIPTPIHIRLYEAPNADLAARFTPRRGAYPGWRRPLRVTRPTAFTERIRQRTEALSDYNGYWLPDAYSGRGELAEYWAVRERVALMDLSALQKVEIEGPDATELLQKAFVSDIGRLKKNQGTYTCLMTPHGGMLDDGIVFRLGTERFRYIGNREANADWLRRLATANSWQVTVQTSTPCLHNLALQGPLSREVLRPLITLESLSSIDELGFFRAATGYVGRIPVFVSRTGYTGELGFELFVAPEHGAALWDCLLEAGAESGISPLGMQALNRARIEAGLISPGVEFDDSVSPLQAGIGWTIRWDKPDFIGKAALDAWREHPPRVAVGLILDGDEVAPCGETLYVPGEDFRAGRITSATFSPVLGKSIALAQVFPTYATPGTVLEVGFVDGHLRRVPAVVGPMAAYDPQKRRVRA